MSGPQRPVRPAAEERVIVVFLESRQPRTVAGVVEALEARGFDVYPASAASQTSVELDYENARYLVVGLTGEFGGAAAAAAAQEAATPTGHRTKVLLFPGAPTSLLPADAVHLELVGEIPWADAIDVVVASLLESDVRPDS